MKDSQMMTKKEVATYWGVSPRTVNRWVAQGILIPQRKGGTLRFKRSDVEAI